MVKKDKIDIDELKKSLEELQFGEAEVASIVEKAIKENASEEDNDDEEVEKPKADEPKGDDTKTIDEEDNDKAQSEMKKAFDKVMSAKTEFDKSMEEFLNKFGSVPGMPTPDTDFAKKKDGEPIQKAFGDDFEKAFGEKFDTIMKGFENQTTVNNELIKSIAEVRETVNAIAETPNPLKGIFGNYGQNILEKGEKTNSDGKRVVSLRNKDAASAEFFKAIDVTENEQDKQIIRDMVSSFNISGQLNPVGLNIVKKALDIDFEK